MSKAKPFIYTANQLFSWLADETADIVILDVRNENDFNNFAVEGPTTKPYINIPYFDFIEDVDSSVAKVPKNQKIRVICAQEGSALFVSERNHSA